MKQTELRQLSDERSWELLAKRTVGRLAVAVNGQPDIFPVNYAVDDHHIVIRTAEGMKFAAALSGKSVAFEVDELDAARQTGWSVVIRGTAAEPKYVEDYLRSLDLEISPWAKGSKERFIIISPIAVEGRVLPPATSGCLQPT